MRDKVIITAAITGAIHTPTMSPHLPITPKQIADEAVRAYEAGAAVAHIHVRNPENGQPVGSLDLFRETITDIKNRCPIIMCLTTGGAYGQTIEQRVSVVREFQPELASCNAGSLNFALFPLASKIDKFKFSWEEEFLRASEDSIFPNTFKTLREYATIFQESGTRPEMEVYDLGMISNVAFLVDRGYVRSPIYLQFVLGVLGGASATIENLIHLQKTAHETFKGLQWSVCAAGRYQLPLCTAALVMGGNVRVGLEDNLYLEKGVLAKSNADQVEKIVRIARELGREPATPDEARQILGLKGLDRVRF